MLVGLWPGAVHPTHGSEVGSVLRSGEVWPIVYSSSSREQSEIFNFTGWSHIILHDFLQYLSVHLQLLPPFLNAAIEN